MIEVASFLEIVQKTEQPHMILFWGGGCGPCDRIKPIFEKFSEDNRTEAKFVSVKANDNPKLAGHFKVMAVPTLVRVDKNFFTKRLVGPKTSEDIQTLLEMI